MALYKLRIIIIIIHRLRHTYGLHGAVFDWFGSQSVWYNGQMSDVVALRYGVPQGSVLGPNLFVMYTAEAIAIASRHGFSAHAYADDLQLYDHADPAACAPLISRLSTCVAEIMEWMASSRLRLNSTKTELIWLGASRCVQRCPPGQQLIAGSMIKQYS